MRNLITNYKFFVLTLIHFQINLMILLENFILIKTCLPFSQFQFNTILFIIMYSAIFAGKCSLSSTSATKVYLYLDIFEVAKIIDKCIFLKLLITKKNDKYHFLSHKIPFTFFFPF